MRTILILVFLFACAQREKSTPYRAHPKWSPETEYHGPLKTDGRTFTDTSRWSKQLEIVVNYPLRPRYLPGNFEELIALTPPPENSSATTASELSYLRSLKAHRTPETLDRIRRERDRGGQVFGPFPAHDLGIGNAVDPVGEYLTFGVMEVQTLTIFYKKKFNRIRPSVLEPLVAPVFSVPLHPAYPSGHSAEAFMIANLLSKLDPARTAAYERSALEIGMDREIAGVHYPSDTAAGAELARKTTDLLFKNPEFLSLFEAAKKYWDSAPEYHR